MKREWTKLAAVNDNGNEERKREREKEQREISAKILLLLYAAERLWLRVNADNVCVYLYDTSGISSRKHSGSQSLTISDQIHFTLDIYYVEM